MCRALRRRPRREAALLSGGSGEGHLQEEGPTCARDQPHVDMTTALPVPARTPDHRLSRGS